MIARRAFTLLELLTVIVIFAIVIAIAVPSFNALLYTSSQSQAANQLQVGIQAARDAAIRSRPGADAAAVFFFEPGGRCSIVPCVVAGVLRDAHPSFPNDPDQFVEREIFVPVGDFEPVSLPPSWVVRAYAPRETLHHVESDRITGWYDDGDGGNSDVYPDPLPDDANWIFPETGFYALDATDAGRARQTFMIRFEGATGRQNVTDTRPVLVVAPALRSKALINSLPSSMRDYRIDRASSLDRFVQAVLGAPAPALSGGAGSKVKPLRLEDKRQILGDQSIDTVLARPLGQVALYDVRRLAGSIGARAVNRETGCLIMTDRESMADPEAHATLDGSLFGGLPADEINERIREWIEDRYNPDGGAPQDRTPSDARVFGIRRYDGAVIELTGTKVQT